MLKYLKSHNCQTIYIYKDGCCRSKERIRKCFKIRRSTKRLFFEFIYFVLTYVLYICMFVASKNTNLFVDLLILIYETSRSVKKWIYEHKRDTKICKKKVLAKRNLETNHNHNLDLDIPKCYSIYVTNNIEWMLNLALFLMIILLKTQDTLGGVMVSNLD